MHLVTPPRGDGSGTEPRGVQRGGEYVGRSFTADGDHGIAGPHATEQKLERTDLVATQFGRVEIVAFDPEIVRLEKPGEAFDRRRKRPQSRARDGGEGGESADERKLLRSAVGVRHPVTRASTPSVVVILLTNGYVISDDILDVQHLHRDHHGRKHRHGDEQSEEPEHQRHQRL
jgi:hypothetical protein